MIKARSWEYWPFELVYGPVFIYWLILSIRARSLLFFSASNPSIETGGMLGESKNSIFKLIPKEYLPKTISIDPKTETDAGSVFRQNNFHFPVICKPDVGERGNGVVKIESDESLQQYHDQSQHPYLIQEFLEEPIELGIFYYRYPNSVKGTISSIVMKEMLHVTGNGSETLRDLILNTDRAKIHAEALFSKFYTRLDDVIPEGKKIELVEIGNHCRGTKFLNANHLINEQLTALFDGISSRVSGFYFGRYDIKVESLDALFAGKIKIMELNGAGSEPAHIYQPGYSLLKAYRCLFHHWTVLYKISYENHRNGIPYMTLKEGWSTYRQLKLKQSFAG